ncbi:hypothetical protein [Hydrogenophaga sp.]|uniref:hypothetical protein n=1 Tax=Hydrogenophaga sp. TaxID=1904254 RepID=UPI003F72DD53
MPTAVYGFAVAVFERGCRAWLLGLAMSLVAGCSVLFISPHDQAAVDRVDQISKSVLGFYQGLLDTAPAQRKTALASTLGKSQGDIETQMRLHLLREQARTKNEDSVRIASNMLESWQKFASSHLGSDPTALTNATLGVERMVMERHLASAFKAEEAKKFGGS